jgi:hypothetical protein
MKKMMFILLISVSGFSYAQQSKSNEIQREIKRLELENNKLILEQYISEKTDSMSEIPLFRNNTLLMTNFQDSHPDFKQMRAIHDFYIKQCDSIKNCDSEYKKLNKQLNSATTSEETMNIHLKINQINERLSRENKQFKELTNKAKALNHKAHLAMLKLMLIEYQASGILVPVNFMAHTNLMRYQNNFTVAENMNKLKALHELYHATFEKEFAQKNEKKDSIK